MVLKKSDQRKLTRTDWQKKEKRNKSVEIDPNATYVAIGRQKTPENRYDLNLAVHRYS